MISRRMLKGLITFICMYGLLTFAGVVFVPWTTSHSNGLSAHKTNYWIHQRRKKILDVTMPFHHQVKIGADTSLTYIKPVKLVNSNKKPAQLVNNIKAEVDTFPTHIEPAKPDNNNKTDKDIYRTLTKHAVADNTIQAGDDKDRTENKSEEPGKNINTKVDIFHTHTKPAESDKIIKAGVDTYRTLTKLADSDSTINIEIDTNPDSIIDTELDTDQLDILEQDQHTKHLHNIKAKAGSHRKARRKHPPGETCVKRLPQAIIIGIQKSGTSTLLTFLNDHPQIAACTSPAEPMFFSMYMSRGLEWYRHLMPCSYSNQITIEKSPPYFFRRYSAEGIRKMNHKTKLIITVKEPIERAISMYASLKAHHQVGSSFEDYVTTNKRTKIKTGMTMIQFSNYPKYMKYWLDNFNLKQILIIDGQNFIDDPSSELKKVEQFLNIDSHFTPEKFVFDKKKGKNCLIRKSGVKKCMGSNKGHAHPKVHTNVISLLQKYFKHKNEQFFRMIKRPFDWGY